MGKKTTYKELEQKIKELENEVLKRRRAEAALRNAHTEFEQWAEDQNTEVAKTVRPLKGEIKARDRAR